MSHAQHTFTRAGALLALDLRSLVLLRVGLAVLVLADLVRRWSDHEAHYGAQGVLPVDSWLALHGVGPGLLTTLVPSSEAQIGALFGACAAAAVALGVGFGTRVATFASWFLLFAIQGRNIMVLNGGDILLRLLLFWSLFLPLGARASLDALRSRAQGADRVRSWGSAGLIVQVCAVYWFAALLKNHPVWNEEGSALFYALQIDAFSTPLGQRLLEFPSLLRPLTLTVWWAELLGPCLLFSPFRSGAVRTVTVLGFVSLHLGFGLFLQIGIFPLVSMVSWLALLPSEFWERAGSITRAGPGFHRLRATPFGQVNAALALAFILVWNLATLRPTAEDRPRFRTLEALALLSGLHQKWNMFAPRPLVADGWYVIVGELGDGTRVDLMRGARPVSWSKPERVADDYPNQRWRKYLMNLSRDANAQHRPFYADYLCRQWNASPPDGERLDRVRIVFMRERTLPGYGVSPPRPDLLLDQPCPVRARARSRAIAEAGPAVNP